jgi:PAS domain S-box-containing protein
MLIPIFSPQFETASRPSDAERLYFVSQAIEASVDGIAFTDIHGRISFVNRAFVLMWGYQRAADIGGRLLASFVDPDYAPAALNVCSNWTGEALGVASNGHRFPIAGSITRIDDPSGGLAGFVASFRDVSDRVRAEERVRQSEERLHQAIRVADIGFFDHDHVKGERYWSPELRQIAGLQPDDPLPPHPGTNPAEKMAWMHPDDRELIVGAVARAHASDSDGFYDVEYRFIRPDGEVRWLKVRSQTFFRGEGATRHPVRTVGGAQDITDRKLAEADRVRLQEQLTQAQKMESVGRLAGGVAHDFNNMLSVIIGRVELALHGVEAGAPVRADLEEIRGAARSAADLTRQLLAFARRQVVAPRVLDLNAAVAGSLAMLRRLIGEDIELTWTPSGDAGRVRMDPSHVDQVLTNLAANARDAIDGVGRVTVRTRRTVRLRHECVGHDGMARGPYAVLEVSDTGRGIDPGAAAHLFEPFFTTKPVGRGTGLGLATVYGIVKQNGGCIEVDSEIGRGTTVRIFLPSVEADVTGATTDMAAGLTQSGHETVLLVEDESAVLRLSKIVLERFGYNVLTAGTPAEAIQLFESHQGRVHLLVTDVVMPEMNGRELAARLRESRPELKTLFVSGYSASALAPRGVLDEGVHFLQKPFSLEDLANSVRHALDAQGD